jgi:hypothetical protein
VVKVSPSGPCPTPNPYFPAPCCKS